MPTDGPPDAPAPQKQDTLSPEDELELAELAVRDAAVDEFKTMFDHGEHPKPPHAKEEGVTTPDGSELASDPVDADFDVAPAFETDLEPGDLNDLGPV